MTLGAPRSPRAVAVCLALACATASAQDDPLFDGVEEETPAPRVAGLYGDFLLRGDQVRNLGFRDDVERARVRGRIGWRMQGERFEWGVAAEAAAGTDDNDDNRRNNDNERSDDLNLDEAFVRWLAGEQTTVLLGKAALPLALTPLTWDDDLRPVGASLEHSFALGEIDRVSLAAGYFAGDHLYGDDSRIAAFQAGWHIREGAPWSGDILLSFLDFDGLDTLAREGLARTNRRVGTALVSDYRLLDLQLGLRADAGGWPLAARLDLVRNFGADDQRDGARFSLVLGDSALPGGWEFGYAVQRIQRDAVMAAFNQDDWWFHSFARGSMPWIAYGIDEVWSVRLAGFFERRDDQGDTVHRALLDLRARW